MHYYRYIQLNPSSQGSGIAYPPPFRGTPIHGAPLTHTNETNQTNDSNLKFSQVLLNTMFFCLSAYYFAPNKLGMFSLSEC